MMVDLFAYSTTSAAGNKTVKGKDDKAAANSRNLWVSGLSSSTRATDLKALFGKYGKVVGAKVVTNARSPGWRCYGFVTMASADETTKCIQHLHRTELHGKMISVERFSSFKAKTGGLTKTASSGAKAASGPRPISSKTASAKKDDKKTPSTTPRKEGAKKEGEKEGDKKKDGKEVKKDDKSKPSDRRGHRDSKGSSRDRGKERSRHRDEKSREQRERDMLSFEKIRAERERERLRQKEMQLRGVERFRMEELDRERSRQKQINRKQREEAIQLEREKEKIRMERQRLEMEKQEAERLRRESTRLKRLVEDKLRREETRLAEERRAVKRSAPTKTAEFWSEGAAKQARKEISYKPEFSERSSGDASRYASERSGLASYERKVEKYDRREEAPRFEARRDERDERRVESRSFDSRRDERRDSHREVRKTSMSGGSRDIRTPTGGREVGSSRAAILRGSSPTHDSRSEWKSQRSTLSHSDRRDMGGSRQAWGAPADNHSKSESSWSRAMESSGGSANDRWMGNMVSGSTQRGMVSGSSQRGMAYPSYASSGPSGMYMSSALSAAPSGLLMNPSLARQPDNKFSFAAITSRRL